MKCGGSLPDYLADLGKCNIAVSVFPPLALWQPQFLCLCTTTCICGLKQFVSGQRSLVFLHLQCLTLQKNITSFLLGMLVNNLWLVILCRVVRLINFNEWNRLVIKLLWNVASVSVEEEVPMK